MKKYMSAVLVVVFLASIGYVMAIDAQSKGASLYTKALVPAKKPVNQAAIDKVIGNYKCMGQTPPVANDLSKLDAMENALATCPTSTRFVAAVKSAGFFNGPAGNALIELANMSPADSTFGTDHLGKLFLSSAFINSMKDSVTFSLCGDKFKAIDSVSLIKTTPWSSEELAVLDDLVFLDLEEESTDVTSSNISGAQCTIYHGYSQNTYRCMKGKTIFIKGVSNDTALANDQLQQLSLMLSGNGLQNELGFAWNNIMISSDVKAALFKKIGDDGFDQADYHEIGIANSNMIRHVVVAGITTKDMLVDAKMFYDQKIVAAILGYADKSELTFTKLWKLLDQHNQNTPSEEPSGDQGVPSTPTKFDYGTKPAQSPQSSSEAQEMKPYSPTFKILDKVIIK